MSSITYFSNIQKYFLQYADLVESSNSFGLTDESIHAENLFAEILNSIFNWNLKNANELNKNQSSFDLVDEKRLIYIQVTANKKHKSKFENATNTFKNPNGKNPKIQFIVLFISKKVGKTILDGKQIDNVIYEGYDIPKLLNKINYNLKTPAELKKLNDLLQSTIYPVLLLDSPIPENIINPKIPLQGEIPIGRGLYIKRENLILKLLKFCQADNGLLIGGPGFGKSFIINELQRHCHSQNIPCYILRINEFTDGNDAEISSEIKSPIEWLEVLKKVINKNAQNGILIFDAFDTAKDERLKATIYKQINKAIGILKGKWNILVSTRTYDAAKSTLLQEIFPHVTVNQVVSCRNFEIPELDDNELKSALEQNKILKNTVDKSGHQLQKLLKTPYFIKLLEQIVSDNETAGESLSGIETEAQLLEIFWQRKIEDLTKKGVLVQKLTKFLVAKESLTGERDDIVTDSNSGIFDSLVSLNILENSTSDGRISFTHNILLDYAISKYLLVKDVIKQIKFLKENQKLPFIFRQSFIYFYSQLWKSNQEEFWKHYSEIQKIDTPAFRLFHQTILNYILVSFYNSPNELLPYLQNDNSENQGNIIRKALESIRFVTKGNLRHHDIDLLLAISSEMHYSFVWEIGNLIEKGIKMYQSESKPQYIKKLSTASYNYLEFILKEKDTKDGVLVLHNGRYWGIENVCKTFQYNKTRAKTLIKKVLLMLNHLGFDINLFQTLSNNLLPIFTADKIFGMLVYKTLYLHNENSNEVTNWGGGIVNLRSNRKQDFGHIHWVLEKNYPDFLKIDFAIAMPIGVTIINKFSELNSLGYQKENLQMKVGIINAVMSFDYDNYEEDEEHGAFAHVKKIFYFFEETELNSKSIKEVKANLYLLIGKIEAGKLWRRLLNYLLKHPQHFKKLSYEILSNIAIYENDDTLHEAGKLLKSIWDYLSLDEKKKIEHLVHRLKQSSIIHPELVNRRISRLLNCIPEHDFAIPESKVFVVENQKVENALIVEQNHKIAAQVRYHTEEEKVLYAGFDFKISVDREVYSHYETIEKFSSTYENGENKTRLKVDYKNVLPAVTYIFEKVKSKSFRNEQIKKSCDFEVSICARILSGVGKKLLKKEQEFIETIALNYINDSEYKSSTYEEGKMNDRFGGANGPMIRTGCIHTLQNLLYDFNNENAWNTLYDCMNDNATSIRYSALHSLTHFWEFKPELFWKIIKDRLIKESDAACFRQLVESIHHEDIIAADLSNVKEACLTIAIRLREVDNQTIRETWQMFIHTILKIIFRHDKEMAFKLILDNLDVKEFSRNLIFEIRTCLNSFNAKDDFLTVLEKGNVMFDILMEILQYRFKSIQDKGSISLDLQNDFEIIDHVIQNLYFAFDYDEDNKKGRKLSHLEKEAFYRKMKPIIEYAANESSKIDNGFMALHTGYYFMMLLNLLLHIDPENILKISNIVVLSAANNGFTYDRSALTEIVKLTERIIVDYKSILLDKENFNNLIVILDQFASSGSEEAVELTWRLKEVF